MSRLDKTFFTRMSTAQHQEVEAAATRYGQRPSRFVRAVLHEYMATHSSPRDLSLLPMLAHLDEFDARALLVFDTGAERPQPPEPETPEAE